MREAPDYGELSLADLTAKAIFLEKKTPHNTATMWGLLEKVYGLFIDVILDLGEYSKAFAQDKNVFYLYLSQYLIPASSIIDNVANQLINSEKKTKIPVHITGSYNENGDNLLTRAKISIDYTFYNDFINQFDILQKALDEQLN
jgi:hypothetical protein